MANFIYPCTSNITSPFRPPNRPNHNGIDFSEGVNEPIHASASGVVSRSYVSDSYGEVVFIKHNINGQQYETVYAHMLTGSRLVQENDNVIQGQQIGIMGNTGDSQGIHLHFEMNIPEWVQGGANAVDPLPYLENGSGDIEIICGNRYLDRNEMKGNAQYIANYFIGQEWTAESIAGMLGNMERESTINPCLWESLESYDHDPYITVQAHGYGLVQWTPFNNLTVWARDNGKEYNNIKTQLDRLVYEKENGLEWYTYQDGFPHALPETWEQFRLSKKSPEYLAEVFMENYERPHRDYLFLEQRKQNARYWYETLDWSGSDNGDIGGETKEKKHKDLIMLLLTDALHGWKF